MASVFQDLHEFFIDWKYWFSFDPTSTGTLLFTPLLFAADALLAAAAVAAVADAQFAASGRGCCGFPVYYTCGGVVVIACLCCVF